MDLTPEAEGRVERPPPRPAGRRGEPASHPVSPPRADERTRPRLRLESGRRHLRLVHRVGDRVGRRDPPGRVAEPVGRGSGHRRQGAPAAPDGSPGHSHGGHRPARRGSQGRLGRDAVGTGDRGRRPEHPGELRGPHPPERRAAHRRDQPAGGDSHRGLHLHRQLADSAVRRGLDAGQDSAGHRGGGPLRRGRGPAGNDGDGRHDPGSPRDPQGHLRDGHSQRREAVVPGRHRGARRAGRSPGPGPVRPGRDRGAVGRGRGGGLATPWRPSKPEPPGSTERRWASASGSATRKWTCCWSTSSCWGCTTET